MSKLVPFVSTPKKAGGARPQRGSKYEEVTPVPGGEGAGGEVRKEPETPTISRRAKSTTQTCPHLVCLLFPKRPFSPALMSLQFVDYIALHMLLPEETQQTAHLV